MLALISSGQLYMPTLAFLAKSQLAFLTKLLGRGPTI